MTKCPIVGNDSADLTGLEVSDSHLIRQLGLSGIYHCAVKLPLQSGRSCQGVNQTGGGWKITLFRVKILTISNYCGFQTIVVDSPPVPNRMDLAYMIAPPYEFMEMEHYEPGITA